MPANLPTPRSVAIVLHGNPETEADLLSQPYLRSLADETGTILPVGYSMGGFSVFKIGPAAPVKWNARIGTARPLPPGTIRPAQTTRYW